MTTSAGPWLSPAVRNRIIAATLVKEECHHGAESEARAEGERPAPVAVAYEEDRPGDSARHHRHQQRHQGTGDGAGPQGQTEGHTELHVAEAHTARADEVDDEQDAGHHRGTGDGAG